MTAALLTIRILKVKGIKSVRPWRRRGEDRLYITWEDSDPESSTYVDLRAGLLFGSGTWRDDPHGLGARSLSAVRELVREYRAALAVSAKK